MAWSRYHLAVAVVMVFTGTINTLSMKWADNLQAVGKDGREPRPFDHPFVQTLVMFFGELLCLITFKFLICYMIYRPTIPRENQLTQGNQDFNPLIFLPPAMLDMTATSIMYVGLNLTNPSSFQMLRGSVIVFTEILSMTFLERQFNGYRWIGIFMILAGLSSVGLADFLIAADETSEGEKTDTNGIITGDLLIVIAQIITASQMVYEEKYTVDKDVPPLQAVGWEGLFGVIGISLLLIPFSYIHIPPPFANTLDGTVEDIPDALVQIGNNRLIILALVGTMTSIAFFNFAGISMAKAKTATTRMVLDSLRTFFIWMCSLALGWQKFHYLQVIGFNFLIYGMLIYNNMVPSKSDIYQFFTQRQNTTLIVNSQPADEP
ncbi:transport and golgi organization 9 [Lycorma delicatula]|uniref:transport and golgi organization 9 n=1 Tax=Lycorma delicatula TaxID=130591 RepID=UPI003F50F0E9